MAKMWNDLISRFISSYNLAVEKGDRELSKFWLTKIIDSFEREEELGYDV